ncbi:hypothetical protein [Actinomadura sp. WAC 06369]|uniref:hypothetical protein n=1 Tax=Actinomadura sp. WAC 06369 TaxID=2203193 RepID=UPI000F790AEF|nr:hypothetical protein [Actinomadura sp. WAC 06369]RSN51412.1 hypothetical protein DMH08_30690 [Actinomadura sp. WAC 06369]
MSEIDVVPRDWGPEQARSTVKAEARRAFWRRTGPGFASFVVGWCILALVVALAGMLPGAVAAVAAVGTLCLICAGQATLLGASLQEAVLPWVLTAMAGAPLVAGVALKVSSELPFLGMGLVGIVSLVSLVAYMRSYRRIVSAR